jgi:hypothetical protein
MRIAMSPEPKLPEEVHSGKRVLFSILAFMIGTIVLLIVLKVIFKLQ